MVEKNEHKFLLFGDNMLESKHVMDIVKEYCFKNEKIFSDSKIYGCPALPIFKFTYKNQILIIECRGNYDNWIDIPPKIKDYISFFDKPDVVLYDIENDKIIAAAEFTETVAVGNSQWQRSGRAVAAGIFGIPFLAVYPCVAEDRSQNTLREPTALLTEFFLKLSLEDPKSPILLLLGYDPYLETFNKNRKEEKLPIIERPVAGELIGKWFGLRLILSVDKNLRPDLIKIEDELYKWMFQTLNEKIKRGKKILKRIDNDLPYWNKRLNNPSNIKELRYHTLADISLVPWDGVSGKIATNSYFNKIFVKRIKKVLGNNLKTYVKGGKHFVIDSKYTKDVEKILIESYPPHKQYEWKIGFLDRDLPCAFIPLQGWQRGGLTLSDPNCGEAVAFPALFSSLKLRKSNIIFIIYGKPHKNWFDLYKKNNKLFRAIKNLGDLLCLDNENKPVSIGVIR